MRAKNGLTVPPDLAQALRADGEVLKAWESLRPSCQREYLDWVAEAMRERRVASVLKQASAYYGRHRAKGGAA